MDLIFIPLGFVAFMCAYLYFTTHPVDFSKWKLDKPIKPVEDLAHSKHIKPGGIMYDGGWCSITICEGCTSIGFYHNQHPVNPCRKCGCHIMDRSDFAGIWRETRWELNDRATKALDRINRNDPRYPTISRGFRDDLRN